MIGLTDLADRMHVAAGVQRENVVVSSEHEWTARGDLG